jgi:hypothetical protein
MNRIKDFFRNLFRRKKKEQEIEGYKKAYGK